jgi:hypothetical protein
MGSLRYSDIDPNIIELLYQRLETQVGRLIDGKIQRRQQWGPTFKQEDIADLTMTDTNYTIPAPEYGKRTLLFSGTLTATRIVRLPDLFSAWWFVINNTNQALQFLNSPSGTVGPIVGPRQTATLITDGTSVFRSTSNVEELVGVKILVDNTRTNLFQAAFASADLKAVGGTVQLIAIAKDAAVPNIQMYTQTVVFVAEHHGNNLGNARWGAVIGLNDGVTVGGGINFTYECNNVAQPAYAGAANTFTFQLTADSDMASAPTTYLQYTIAPLGEIGITLL